MNVARVSVEWLIADALPCVCVFHVKAADSHAVIDAAARTDIGSAVLLWWTDDGGGFGSTKSRYPSALKLQQVTVRTIQPVDDPALTILAGENEPGTVDEDHPELISYMYPPQVSWLLSLYTDTDSRRGRGRMYLPAMFSFFVFGSVGSPALDRSFLPGQDEFAIGILPEAIRQDVANIGAHLAFNVAHAPNRDDFEFVLAVWSPLDADARAVLHFEVCQHLRTQRDRAVRPSPHDVFDLTGGPAA